jgi:hypothetical protein
MIEAIYTTRSGMRATRSGLRKISGSLLKGQLQKVAFLLKNSKKTNPDPYTV